MDERDRHEYYGERKRGGAYGESDLRGGRFRGGDRIHVFFFDEAENIFEHYYGIVDYYSDRESQCEQRHPVEGEAHP